MKKTLLTIAAAWFAGVMMWAVPAKRTPVTIDLGNGAQAEVTLHGDEDFHYMTREDGQWVRIEDGQLVPMEPMEVAAQENVRSASARARRAPEAVQTATPLNLAPYGLVILVNFSDVQMQPENTLAAWEEFFNSDNYTYQGATGSARQYFIDQSMGQYQPRFDVVGPVTLSNTQAYYGGNNAMGNDQRRQDFARDACRAAYNQYGVNFAKYDNNNDAVVDFVYIIYAGQGEADGGGENTIWPHTGWLGGSLTLSNKKINCYACSNELRQASGLLYRDGVGTFCHEFSHVLGLGDHYNTSSQSSRETKLMGNWDIMDHGSYNNASRTPAGYTAYERFFFGWLKPTLLNHPATMELGAINTTNEACIITETAQTNFKGNDPNPTEFYMLENRQKTGWDKYIPGHGLLITRIDYRYNVWSGNTINNTASRLGYDIIEADGLDNKRYYTGKQGDCFPYEDINYFTPYEDMPLTEITETNGVISFDFMGGTDPFSSLALELAQEDEKLQDYTQIIALYDVTGKRVLSDPPYRNLTPGMYIIALSNGKRTRGVKIYISNQ